MRLLKTLTLATAAASLALVSLHAQARDFRLGLITPPQHLWSTEAEAFAEADDARKRIDDGEAAPVSRAGGLGDEEPAVVAAEIERRVARRTGATGTGARTLGAHP